MNPYKANPTAAQRAAIDAGRAELLRQLHGPPYNAGQVPGEFRVEYVKEWVDATCTWDQFIVQHAAGRLDDSWHRLLAGGEADVLFEGKDTYTVYVPHTHYFAGARRRQYGLPCMPDAPCACRLAGQVIGATLLLYASYAMQNR